jgi:hypothetical protein
VQASYDLRDAAKRCAPVNSDECLLSLNAETGELLTSQWTNWTVYKWGPPIKGHGPKASTQRLTWMYGFEGKCQHPYEDFLFAAVDPATATATPIACMSKNTTVHMDEWIADFNAEGSLFATGSGDAETGIPQLLVFDPSTGKTVLDSKLSGLAQALGSVDKFVFVWGVDFV